MSRVMQCAFSRPTEGGRQVTTGWIPFDKRIKPGWSVELIETGEVWLVDGVFSVLERESINRGWHNNI